MNTRNMLFTKVLESMSYGFNVSISSNTLEINISKENFLHMVSLITLHFENTYMSLMDIVSIDTMEIPRFQLRYLFLNMWMKTRLCVIMCVEVNSYCESLYSIFNSANWLEREVFDMFGITFNGHKDLRRILTDYGFYGFPMRKDFPISGYYEVYYDEVIKRVVTESLSLTQEFRLPNFTLSWKNLC
jgi:NADH-quinone oxidoreductase subunit C